MESTDLGLSKDSIFDLSELDIFIDLSQKPGALERRVMSIFQRECNQAQVDDVYLMVPDFPRRFVNESRMAYTVYGGYENHRHSWNITLCFIIEEHHLESGYIRWLIRHELAHVRNGDAGDAHYWNRWRALGKRQLKKTKIQINIDAAEALADKYAGTFTDAMLQSEDNSLVITSNPFELIWGDGQKKERMYFK